MVRRAAHFGFLWTRRQRSLADSWNVQGDRASNNEGAGQGHQIKEIKFGTRADLKPESIVFCTSILMYVKIENWMRYSYEEPVSFSTHAIRLYPRTDQSITTHHLQTTVNIESDIQYRRDLFDNIVANCFLPKPGEVLEFRVELEIELCPKNPFHFLLAARALQLPFEYTSEESRVLSPFRTIHPEEEADAREVWQ